MKRAEHGHDDETTLPTISRETRSATIYGIGLPLAAQLRDSLIPMACEDCYSDIHLYINSAGGHIHESLAIADVFNEIREIFDGKARVVGHVSGTCQSAATFLLQYCDHRIASEYSELMVHGIVDSPHDLDMNAMKQAVKSLQMAIDGYADIFAARTKWSRKKWEAILADSHPIYLTANEALEAGLIDEVLPAWRPAKKR